jgi:N-acyl-D-amino-acid deacylase
MAASHLATDSAGKLRVPSRALTITIAAFTWATSLATMAQTVEPAFDVVLRHGRIVDGTGNPGIHADLAIKDRRIAAIGKIDAKGKQEFDATGLVIAPGFIDVHTHAEDIDDQPLAENFLRMGVTSLMLGNCGDSALNIGEFLRQLETITVSPNVATLVGHGTVRRRAMHGSFDRPPTEAEMAEMKALVRRGMDEGAFGISTGLIYLPSVFAKTEEIIELAKVVSEYDGIYATHQRSESNEIFQSLDEIFRIAREGHVRAEISHLKLSGPANWGKADEVIAAIERARSEGLDITQDQYAYTASSTGLNQLIPETAREGGRDKFIERLNVPETKAGIIEEMKKTLQKRQSADYAYAVIAGYKPDPSFNGLNVVEAAMKLRGADSLDDQIETIFEIEKAGGASAVFHGMSETDLEAFMKHPNTMFASDSGVRKFQKDIPHPRGYGNAARILGQYVREKKVLRLEDAIRRMTSLPARTFRIKDRGELREGAWADIAVFAPELVNDPSTYKDPHHYAIGMKYVFVNGTLVVENDQHNGARPGMILRHEAMTKPQVKSEQAPAVSGRE